MPTSGAPLKSKKRVWLVRLSLAAAVLLLLVLALGPTLFLNLTLSRLLPADSGLVLSYGRARAGFMLRSAEVTDLVIGDPVGGAGPPVLNFRRLRLDGVSTWNLIRLLRHPDQLPPSSLFLAEEVSLEGLGLNTGHLAASLEEAQARRLRLQPKAAAGQPPLTFAKLEARNLSLSTDSESFKLSRLEARDLGPEFLAGLGLRDFHYDYQTGQTRDRREFRLDALNLGGLRLEAVRRLLTSETAGQALWVFLASCDTLDLVRGSLTRTEREALNIKSVSFDSVSRPDGATGFLRRLDLAVDLPALAGESPDPFWSDLRDLAGDRFQAALNLELDYNQASTRAELKTARLEAPELGRLELTGALTGVTPLKSHHSLSQLLLSTGGWSLEKLDFSFEDRGLAANFYRHLDRTVFRGAPHHQSAANIIDYVLNPLAQELEYEQGLDNLPALVNEAEAFLQHPRSFKLSAAPLKPLALLPVINSLTFMSLANQGKYDIIEKLRLTLAVNDRAPIFVAVASGVFKENLPLAPRPMEKAFDDEAFTEEDI